MLKINGFTLLELMVSLAIVAILAMISTSFTGMLRNNQVSTITQQFVTDLNYARNLAISHNTRITLCKSDSDIIPRQCVSDNGDTGWDQGWIVFIDVNNDQQLMETDNNLLKVSEKLVPFITLVGNTPVRNYISFQGSGFSRKQNGSLQMGSLALCNASASESPLRIITISSAGRTRISRSKANSENNISCSI